MLTTANELSTLQSKPISCETNFYGLLEPDCSWGLNKFGGDLRVVLIGNETFLKKNATLFSSFVGAHACQRVAATVATVTITETKMKKAFSLYLYGQLFQKKAKIDLIRDDGGEIVSSEVLNDNELQSEADRLAAIFVAGYLHPAYSHVGDPDSQVQGGSMEIHGCGRIGAESTEEF